MKKKILLEKTASEIAKEHGLIYGGFGGWVDPKTREVKARTVDGKFVPVDEDPGSNAKEDLGKVIGKEGRTARSIRTLVHAAASKEHKRAVLEILE